MMELRRHFDFERIYNEFLNYYKTSTLADREYYEWIKDMSLDETLEYGQARESFKWAKDMISLLKEDTDNKYYQILVGLPLRSMNGNAYKERDLIAGALTLKGKHPSLNHEDEYWFSPVNPKNRWGEITVVDAKYEEGAVEAILQVPKSTVCPICDGKPMTELIDDKKILNVSLEGDCKKGQAADGSCDGFYFTDPPFTLLTTEVVLPGIPLARIKPMESYLPFNKTKSRSSLTNRGENKIKTKEKTKLKIKVRPKKTREEGDPAKMGHKKPGAQGRDTSADTNVFTDPYYGTSKGPSGEDSQFRGNLQGVSQQTNVAMGRDPAESKPEGVWNFGLSDPESNPSHEATTGTPLHVKPSDEPDLITAGDPMPNIAHEDPVGPSKTSDPNPDLTTSELPSVPTVELEPPLEPDTYDQPATQPEQPTPVILTPYKDDTFPSDETEPLNEQDEPCDVGMHWDAEAGKCVDDFLEEAEECGDGMHWDVELGKCVDDVSEEAEDCGDGFHWSVEQGKCVEDVSEEAEPCEDGSHWDVEAGKCVPDADATAERVRRIKAEYKMDGLQKNLRYVEALWINKYTKLSNSYQKLHTSHSKYEALTKELRRNRNAAENKIDGFRIQLDSRREQVDARLREAREKFDNKMQDLKIELSDYKSRYGASTRESSKFAKLTEDLQIENAKLKQKYHGALSLNLKMSRDVTKANEDYLVLAKQREKLQEALKRAKINSKKTLKIRV